MDDYECANTREWDDPLRRPDFKSANSEQADGGWSVVTFRGRKGQKGNKTEKDLRAQKTRLVQDKQPLIGNAAEKKKTKGQHRNGTAIDPTFTTPQRRPQQKHNESVRRQFSKEPADSVPISRLIPEPPEPPVHDELAPTSESETTEEEAAPPRRPTPKLLQVDDNAAELAWRNREPPRAHILIPVQLLSYGSHGKEAVHEKIARHHDAFIFCQNHGDHHHFTFGVWGTEVAVQSAITALNNWIKTSQDANKSSRSFARLNSFTSKDTQQWERQMKRHQFRQNPPPEEFFETTATFSWPVEFFRPGDTLGMSYEALDPIRMEFSCYIIWMEEESTFRICGKNDKVQEAVDRITGALYQIAARQIAHLRLFLLYWPDAAFVPSHVSLTPYEHPKCVPTELAPHRTGHVPRAEEGDLLALDSGNPNRSAAVKLQEAMLETLQELLWYRGCIQMRVRLGTFLATKFKKPKHDGRYALENYANMITMSQFKGCVTSELGNRDIEESALTTLQKSEGLIVPGDSYCDTLADVKPEYHVTFTFTDPAGDIRLTLVWSHVGDATHTRKSSLEISSKRWTRLERDTRTPVDILDASLKDLHTGMAWGFEISATQPLEESRLSEGYQTFGANVKIIPDAALSFTEGKGQLFVVYHPPGPKMKLRHIHQRTVYRYIILSSAETKELSDYVVELSRFQDFEYSNPALSLPQPHPGSNLALQEQRPQRQQEIIQEPRWSLSVHRSGWDINFAENADLKIGTNATWFHDGTTWFPEEKIEEEENDVGKWETNEKTASAEGNGLGEYQREAEEGQNETMELGEGFKQMLKKLERVKDVVCG